MDFKNKFNLKDSSFNDISKEWFFNKDYLKYLEDWFSKTKLTLSFSKDIKEIFYCWKNSIVEIPKCPICRKEVGFSYNTQKRVRKIKTFCSRSCANISRKNNSKFKENISNTWKNKSKDELKERLQKSKNTCLDRYGVEYNSQREIVKQKMQRYYKSDDWKKVSNNRKQKLNEIYGVNSISQTQEVKEKIKECWRNKDEKTKEEINKKRSKTNLSKYGNMVVPNSKRYIEKNRKETLYRWNTKLLKWNIETTDYNKNKVGFKCNRCNEKFDSFRTTVNSLINIGIDICPTCNSEYFQNISKSGISNSEKEILSFIKTIYYGNIIENYTIPNQRKEIDLFLPELNIGIEYNGLFWHSEFKKEKNYHIEKRKLCKDNKIFLINIWEDDWLFKKDIVKSLLRNKLNSTDKKIYARKCTINTVSFEESKKFLNENHIQGWCSSSIRLGLFYENKLVSLLTFGKSRNNKNELELLRFCSLLDTLVIGGFSKILSYFIKNFEFDYIVSYANNDISDGNVYQKNGFVFKGSTKPGYYWCFRNQKFNRFKFRKQKLIENGFDKNLSESEIMHSRGFFRVFDTGNDIYQLVKN